MEPVENIAQWHNLFVMVGATAGTLVGLLFVAVTLHIDKIDERSDENMRLTVDGARNNTLHLLTVLIEAAAVLVPQPAVFLGAELIVLNVLGLRLPFTIVRKYFGKVSVGPRGGFPTAVIVTITLAYLGGAVGGAALAAGYGWALYLVAASCVAKVVRAVLTAWMLSFDVRLAAAKPKG